MCGERREDQHRLAFQHAAEGEDPVAMGGDERREAQAASGKVAAAKAGLLWRWITCPLVRPVSFWRLPG